MWIILKIPPLPMLDVVMNLSMLSCVPYFMDVYVLYNIIKGHLCTHNVEYVRIHNYTHIHHIHFKASGKLH